METSDRDPSDLYDDCRPEDFAPEEVGVRIPSLNLADGLFGRHERPPFKECGDR